MSNYLYAVSFIKTMIFNDRKLTIINVQIMYKKVATSSFESTIQILQQRKTRARKSKTEQAAQN